MGHTLSFFVRCFLFEADAMLFQLWVAKVEKSTEVLLLSKSFDLKP